MKGFDARWALYKLCVRKNWYTGGDCREYERMLSFVEEIDSITDEGIKTVAYDILNHTSELNPYRNGDVKKVMAELYAIFRD